jgi:hypothetical protein
VPFIKKLLVIASPNMCHAMYTASTYAYAMVVVQILSENHVPIQQPSGLRPWNQDESAPGWKLLWH